MDPNVIPSVEVTCKPLLIGLTEPGTTDRVGKTALNY